MRKITICIVFICIFAGFSQARIKTVKGNYCGNLSGNRAGSFGFRVGSKLMVFEMNFGQQRDNAKMIRFNVNKLKVGDEFIIRYDDSNEDSKFIQTITGTGKRKKISPCTIE